MPPIERQTILNPFTSKAKDVFDNCKMLSFLGPEGLVLIPETNYLRIPIFDQTNKTKRDIKFEENCTLFEQELENVIEEKNRNLKPINKRIREMQEAGEQPEEVVLALLNKLYDRAANSFFISLINNLNETIGEFAALELEEGQETWESLLQKHIREKYVFCLETDNFFNLKTFAITLFQAAFYSAFNANLVQYNEATRQESFEKIKSAADLQDCAGGASSALTSITSNLKGENSLSLWGEFEEKMTQQIQEHCQQGHIAHIPSWLRFLASGKMDGDENVFMPSSSISMANVKRIVEAVTFRGNNSIVGLVAKNIVNLVNDVAAKTDLALKDSLQPPDKEEWEDYFETELDIARAAPSYKVISKMTNADLLAVYESKDKMNIAANLFSNREKFTITHGAEIQEYSRNIILKKMPIILSMNTYSAKNMPIPIWLRDMYCNYASDMRPIEELSENSDDYCEILEDKITQELERELKILHAQTNISVPLLKTFNEARQKETLKFHRPPENLQEDSILQSCINAGCSLQQIIESFTIVNKRGYDRSQILNVSGLLFHPNQGEILEFLKSNFVRIDYRQAISRAVVVGDAMMLQNMSRNLAQFIKEGGLSFQLLFPQLDFIINTFRDLLKKQNNDHTLQKNLCDFVRQILTSEVDLEQGRYSQFMIFAYKNCDGINFLNYLTNKLGTDFLCNIIQHESIVGNKMAILAMNLPILETLDNLYIVLEEKDLSGAKEWQSKLALLNSQIAHLLSQRGHNKTALTFYYRAAECEIGSAQSFIGRVFLEGVLLPQDYKEAFKWLAKSYENWHGLENLEDLGFMFRNGLWVEKSLSEAKRFYEEAIVAYHNQIKNDPENEYWINKLVNTDTIIEEIEIEISNQPSQAPAEPQDASPLEQEDEKERAN